jgi:hypothetical protein
VAVNACVKLRIACPRNGRLARFANLRGFSPTGMPLDSPEAMCALLGALGVPTEEMPAGTEGRSALFHNLLANRRMLIVLDNARDSEQVRQLVPRSQGCLVLITSRNRMSGLATADGANVLTLGVLAEVESYGLLAAILSAGRVKSDPVAVSELIALCGRLPLALRDAAVRAAAQPGLPLAALVAEVRDERGRLDALEAGEAATSLRAVFSWSLAGLSERAARVFRLIGVHPGPDVTVAAATSLAGLPRNDARLALLELYDDHLVADHARGRYVPHDLLRIYAAEMAHIEDGDAERRIAVQRLLDHYLHTAGVASGLLYARGTQFALDRPQPGVQPEEIGDSGEA